MTTFLPAAYLRLIQVHQLFHIVLSNGYSVVCDGDLDQFILNADGVVHGQTGFDTVGWMGQTWFLGVLELFQKNLTNWR